MGYTKMFNNFCDGQKIEFINPFIYSYIRIKDRNCISLCMHLHQALLRLCQAIYIFFCLYSFLLINIFLHFNMA